MTKLMAALLALVALAACSSGGAANLKPSGLLDRTSATPYMGFGLTPPQPRPNFVLTDTSGRRFSFGAATRGHPTLLYFGYTHCPDVCPETMADVGLALRHVPAALARKTYVVFVTTDVRRDTAPRISSWLEYFDRGSRAHWVGLRGTQAQIDAAQAAAHVLVASDHGQTHAAALLLFGADNYARVEYTPGGNEQAQLEHDLPLVAGSAS